VETSKVKVPAFRFEKFKLRSKAIEVVLSFVPVLKKRIREPSTPTDPEKVVELANVVHPTVTFVALGILPELTFGTAFQLPEGELPEVKPVKLSEKFEVAML
jgi:hypothetical protein